MVFDRKTNNIFTCCYEDGRVHGYNLGENIQNDIEVEKILTLQSAKGCREIAYIRATHQLAIGFDGGMVSVFNVDDPKHPFYSRKVHRKDVTKIRFLENRNILMTSSKDRSVKFWDIRHGKEVDNNVEEERKVMKKGSYNPFGDLEDDDEEEERRVSDVVEQREEVVEKKKPVVKEESDSDDELMGWDD